MPQLSLASCNACCHQQMSGMFESDPANLALHSSAESIVYSTHDPACEIRYLKAHLGYQAISDQPGEALDVGNLDEAAGLGIQHGQAVVWVSHVYCLDAEQLKPEAAGCLPLVHRLPTLVKAVQIYLEVMAQEGQAACIRAMKHDHWSCIFSPTVDYTDGSRQEQACMQQTACLAVSL